MSELMDVLTRSWDTVLFWGVDGCENDKRNKRGEECHGHDPRAITEDAPRCGGSGTLCDHLPDSSVDDVRVTQKSEQPAGNSDSQGSPRENKEPSAVDSTSGCGKETRSKSDRHGEKPGRNRDHLLTNIVKRRSSIMARFLDLWNIHIYLAPAQPPNGEWAELFRIVLQNNSVQSAYLRGCQPLTADSCRPACRTLLPKGKPKKALILRFCNRLAKPLQRVCRVGRSLALHPLTERSRIDRFRHFRSNPGRMPPSRDRARERNCAAVAQGLRPLKRESRQIAEKTEQWNVKSMDATPHFPQAAR
jgi:hypothetical protein